MKNQFILHGRLTKDPTIKITENEVKFASLSLAVGRSYKNKDNEVQVDYFEILYFDKLANMIEKCLAKGSEVICIGTLQNNTYETKDGKKKKSMCLLGKELDFCGSKVNNGNTQNKIELEESSNIDVGNPFVENYTPERPSNGFVGRNLDSIDIESDDLPF